MSNDKTVRMRLPEGVDWSLAVCDPPALPVKRILKGMMQETIRLDGRVRPKDIVVVLTERQAEQLGRSDELDSYMNHSTRCMIGCHDNTNPFYERERMSPAARRNLGFGLPEYLYGLRLVVE